MKLLLIFALFLTIDSSQAALPSDAQTYLNKIPGKTLTLPFVIKLALLNAEAYRLIGYDFATAGLEELGQLDPLTDTYFQAGGEYFDDNSQKTNPFQPLRAKKWEWNFGFNKNWASGTKTSIGWLYDTNNLQYPSSIGAFGSSFATEYKQSTAVLQLEQSLLKNSFGYSFRKKRKGARIRANAIHWKARDSVESLTLNFIAEYYQSWLMQEQVTSLREQVLRQSRLVRILTKRAGKGAVEKPDLIQIEAVLAATKTQLTVAEARLATQWEKLVVSLKLPKTFLLVDPMDVPIQIDNPIPLSLRVCGKKEPVKTAGIFTLEKKLEALDADFKAAKNDSLPDLDLVAGYRGNSIDAQASTTVKNVLAGQDLDGFGKGPGWNIGLKLKWSLDNSLARATRTKKYIEKEQISSRLKIAVDDLKIQWKDSCRNLRTEHNNEKIFDSVVQQQKKRVKAEGRRFRLGRIPVNQLVTAEEDLGRWEFQGQQKKIQVRQLAWQVQRYSGELYSNLSPQVKVLLEATQ